MISFSFVFATQMAKADAYPEIATEWCQVLYFNILRS
jgi:hypothetical protein